MSKGALLAEPCTLLLSRTSLSINLAHILNELFTLLLLKQPHERSIGIKRRAGRRLEGVLDR